MHTYLFVQIATSDDKMNVQESAGQQGSLTALTAVLGTWRKDKTQYKLNNVLIANKFSTVQDLRDIHTFIGMLKNPHDCKIWREIIPNIPNSLCKHAWFVIIKNTT